MTLEQCSNCKHTHTYEVCFCSDLQVVLRGCLDKLYEPGYLQFPAPDSSGSYSDVCDQQRQSSSGIGETVTDTCICTNSYCNGSPGFGPTSFTFLIGVLSISLLLQAYLDRICKRRNTIWKHLIMATAIECCAFSFVHFLGNLIICHSNLCLFTLCLRNPFST